MVVFYKIWKKHNEIQLIKKQNELEQLKNDKLPTLPWRRITEGSAH